MDPVQSTVHTSHSQIPHTHTQLTKTGLVPGTPIKFVGVFPGTLLATAFAWAAIAGTEVWAGAI